MNTLIALGSGAAYLYSLVATVAPSVFVGAGYKTRDIPGMGSGSGHGMPVYFEAAGAIIALILLGRLLEAKAKGRTGEAIRRLLALQAKTARVVRSGCETDIPVEEVVSGDVVVMRPARRFPRMESSKKVPRRSTSPC